MGSRATASETFCRMLAECSGDMDFADSSAASVRSSSHPATSEIRRSCTFCTFVSLQGSCSSGTSGLMRNVNYRCSRRIFVLATTNRVDCAVQNQVAWCSGYTILVCHGQEAQCTDTQRAVQLCYQWDVATTDRPAIEDLGKNTGVTKIGGAHHLPLLWQSAMECSGKMHARGWERTLGTETCC